eukprot:797644-Lingulodinium_polyedra.AAC.1
MWLMDTGCGHDLITSSDAQKMKDFIRKATTSVNFNTANGTARGTEVVDLFVKEFGVNVEPYVLKSTPNVLSIGLRCMKY